MRRKRIYITEDQFKKIISEELSEVNGALNEKFHELAVYIKDKYERLKVRHKEGNDWRFTITKAEFKKYNVYNVKFDRICVMVLYDNDNDNTYLYDDNNGIYAAYYDGTILLYPYNFEGREEELVSMIEHELTHMVQGKAAEKYIGFRNLSANYWTNYLFAPFEMAARISQLYSFVNEQLQSYLAEAYFNCVDGDPSFKEFYNETLASLNDENFLGDSTLDSILMLSYMQNVIIEFENDTFENYMANMSELENRNNSPMYNLAMDNPEYFPKKFFPKNAESFEKCKAYAVNYYKNSYINYKKKINKTLAPLIMEYFNWGMKEWGYIK